MRRNLAQFMSSYLRSVVPWEKVACAERNEGEAAEAKFLLGAREVTLRVESPDLNPSCTLGSVFLDDERMGPIDPVTWDAVAAKIKAIHAMAAVAGPTPGDHRNGRSNYARP